MIGKYIITQVEDDFEHYMYVKDMSQTDAKKELCREWGFTPQEMNDIINNYWKKQDNIDETGDLGEII
tara:strand:+ start:213 stop:416 length:204 start_codon:yes stop_codon:yes gene_type:complete